MKVYGTFDLTSGKRVFSRESIIPERKYLLLQDQVVSIWAGEEAAINRAFLTSLSEQSTENVEFRLLLDGNSLSSGKEELIIRASQTANWRELATAQVFLPYEIEQLVMKASLIRKHSLIVSHYCYSFDFLPLHGIGISGIATVDEKRWEVHFLSDGYLVTPVLEIAYSAVE